MARRIDVTKPFEFRWPGAIAFTVFAVKDLGEHLVKDELADFAVANGYAKDLDAKKAKRKANPTAKKAAAKPRTRKAKTKATAPAASDSVVVDAKAAELQPDDRLDGQDLADDGGAAPGDSLASAAS